MDLALGVEDARTVEAAVTVLRGLDALPAEPDDFARAAQAAIFDAGLYEAPTLLAFSLAVSELSAASPPLGVVALSAWLFGRVTRGASAPTAFSRSPAGSVVLRDAGPFALKPAGDGTLLTGSSSAIPLAPIAATVFIEISDESGPRIVKVDRQALSVERADDFDGLSLHRIPWGRVVASGVRLNRDAIVAGSDASTLLSSLSSTQNILIAAVAVGVARRAFSLSLDRVKGERISQNTEFSTSDNAVDVDGAALAVQRAAWLCDRGGAHLLESSVAKAFATTAASRVAHRALRMPHHSGDARELRRCYLDAQFLEGFGGPETLQEDTIATSMLQET